MIRIPGLRRLFRIDATPSSVERAVDDELHFHFEETVHDLVARGATPEGARREAERRFGDPMRTRAQLVALDRSRTVEAGRADWRRGVEQDVRYAMRALKRKPGFAAAVVLTLGLGIGANATMFGIVDRLLLRPPAYLAAPNRVHRLYFARVVNGKEFVGGETQYQRYLDITQSASSVDLTAAYAPRRMAVGVGDATRDLAVGGMTASMWSLFDARPTIGRFFTPVEDEAPNGTKVAVLSYRYWQSEYSGATSVLGKSIKIGPSQYTIIGVAPKNFAAMELETASMFIPMTAAGDDAYAGAWAQCRTSYCLTWIEMYARRKVGVSLDATTAELTRAFQVSYRKQIADSPNAAPLSVAKPRVVVASMLAQRGPNQSADSKVALWLLGVAGVVLAIACANVGNLLLGRTLRRRREIAVRIALGVSRGRLLRLLVIESITFSVLGAALGLAITQWGGAIIRNVLMPEVEWTGSVADPRVAALATALALVAGMLSGIVPLFDAVRVDLARSLRAGSRDTGGGRTGTRTALLVAQSALSVVLLVGAGLFVRSVRNVDQVHLGYDADRLLWIEPRLRGIKLDVAARVALRDALLDRARHAPGAVNASLDVSLPFYIERNTELFVPGVDSVQRLGEFYQREVSPTFFATVGTRILRGRGIDATDLPESQRVIVVSESMARVLWPRQDPIGKCVRLDVNTMPCNTVVGVAENIKQASLGDDPSLTYYLPFEQAELTVLGLTRRTRNAGNATMGGIIVRTRANANSSLDLVRRYVQQAMPGAGYVSVTSMNSLLAPQRRSWELGATMFAVFGGLALVLAGIGLYSVIAYSVVERTNEIGVRIALGARAADVLRLVVRDGLRVVVVGVVIGALAALLAGRWVQPLLFQVSPRDPTVFGGVAILLIAVGLFASWLPALRATRVDPNVALRAD